MIPFIAVALELKAEELLRGGEPFREGRWEYDVRGVATKSREVVDEEERVREGAWPLTVEALHARNHQSKSLCSK